MCCILVVVGCQAPARSPDRPQPRSPAVATARWAPRAGAPFVEWIQLDARRAVQIVHEISLGAITQVQKIDGGVLAITASGTLARLDDELRLVAEVRTRPGASRLAELDGHVVVADAGGGLSWLGLEDLSLRPLAQLDDDVAWLGRWRRQLIAVTGFRPLRIHRLDARTGAPIGRVESIDLRGVTWMIDDDRLWFGEDLGEWGGTVGSIDLGRMTLGPLVSTHLGVRGLLRHGDDIVGFGGFSGVQGVQGNVLRLASGRLTEFDGPAIDLDPAFEPVRPPVSRMVDDGPGLLALVGDRLFTLEPDLVRWHQVATIAGRTIAGALPVTGALRLPDRSVVVATRYDGLIRVRDDDVRSGAVQGALPMSPDDVLTAGEVIVAEGDFFWRRTSDTWEMFRGSRGRRSKAVLVRDSAGPLVVVATDREQQIVAWTAADADAAPLAVAPLDATLVALGDEIWQLRDGELTRLALDTGTWELLGAYSTTDMPAGGGHVRGVRIGDEALLLDLDHQRLTRLERSHGGWTLRDLGHAQDLVRLDQFRALVVREGALLRYDATERRFDPVVEAPSQVETVAVDRDGLIWCVSRSGLSVLDGGGRHDLTTQTVSSPATVRLAAAPDGGVLAALGAGGLAHLRLWTSSSPDPVGAGPAMRPTPAR